MKKIIICCLIIVFALTLSFIGIGCKIGTTTTVASQTTEAITTALETAAGETTAKEREPVTLIIWTPQAIDDPAYGLYSQDSEWVKKIKDKYNITLDVQPKAIESWWEVKTAAAVSQSGPDIIYDWGGFVNIIDAGRGKIVMPLNKIIPQDMLNIISGWDGATDTDGNIYGVPFSVSTNGMVLVKSMFDKAGIDISDHPKLWGWDEFTADCDKLLKAGITPIAFANKEGFMGEWWIGGYGASYFNSNAEVLQYIQNESVNSQPFLDMLAKYKTMYDRGYFFEGGNTLDYVNNAFQQIMGGKAAIQACWGGTYKDYVDALGIENVVVTEWPQFGNGKLAKSQNTLFDQCYGVTNWTKHSEEAFLAIQELASTDWGANLIWNVTGEMPSYKQWEFTPSIYGVGWDNYNKFCLSLLKNPDLEAGSALSNAWSSEFGQTFYKENGAFLTGDITAEQFAKDLDIARGIK